MANVPPPPTQPMFVQVPPPDSNGMGIAGFVLSLLGLVSCGLLSPIGLIISVFGLHKEPRGLAIAGLILGIVGSTWMALFGLGMVLAFLGIGAGLGAAGSAIAVAGAALETEVAIQTAAGVVHQYVLDHGGVLPTREQWVKMMDEAEADTVDAWGNELQLRARADGEFEVRSAGLDGLFDTDDDQAQRFRSTDP